jgi:hypothetical protein
LFRRATLPSTRSRTAEIRRKRLPAAKWRPAKAMAHPKPKSKESTEIWFGVTPSRMQNNAIGSVHLTNFGRREVIFIAYLISNESV